MRFAPSFDVSLRFLAGASKVREDRDPTRHLEREPSESRRRRVLPTTRRHASLPTCTKPPSCFSATGILVGLREARSPSIKHSASGCTCGAADHNIDAARHAAWRFVGRHNCLHANCTMKAASTSATKAAGHIMACMLYFADSSTMDFARAAIWVPLWSDSSLGGVLHTQGFPDTSPATLFVCQLGSGRNSDCPQLVVLVPNAQFVAASALGMRSFP